jgi:hypothetical protein
LQSLLPGQYPAATTLLNGMPDAADRRDRAALLHKLERDTLPLKDFIVQMHDKARVQGTCT